MCKDLRSPCQLARRLKAACTMWTAVNRHCHADSWHLRHTGRYAKALPRGVMGQARLLLFFSRNSLPDDACSRAFRVAIASCSEGMSAAVLSAGKAKGPWCGCGREAAREGGQGVPQAACVPPPTFQTGMLLMLLLPQVGSVVTAVGGD